MRDFTRSPGCRGACHRARIRATRWLVRATRTMRRQPSFPVASRNKNFPAICVADLQCDPRNRLQVPRPRAAPIREPGGEAMRFGADESLPFAGTAMQSRDSGVRLPTRRCCSCEHPQSLTAAECLPADFRFRYRAWLRDWMVSEWLSLRARAGPSSLASKRTSPRPGAASAKGQERTET
jgi:hypothetical protein